MAWAVYRSVGHFDALAIADCEVVAENHKLSSGVATLPRRYELQALSTTPRHLQRPRVLSTKRRSWYRRSRQEKMRTRGQYGSACARYPRNCPSPVMCYGAAVYRALQGRGSPTIRVESMRSNKMPTEPTACSAMASQAVFRIPARRDASVEHATRHPGQSR